MIVLGLDPGFSALGIAVMELEPNAETVRRAYVFRTQKSDKKRGVKAADDNYRRAQEIAHHLEQRFKEHRPHAICAGSMSFPRSSSVAAKMAMTWGVLAATANHYDVPMVMASPQEVKLAICGRKDASKDDIRFAVERRAGDNQIEWPEQTTLIEHAADAVAVIYACLDTEIIRAIRRAGEK